jgi:hypothetical protein
MLQATYREMENYVSCEMICGTQVELQRASKTLWRIVVILSLFRWWQNQFELLAAPNNVTNLSECSFCPEINRNIVMCMFSFIYLLSLVFVPEELILYHIMRANFCNFRSNIHTFVTLYEILNFFPNIWDRISCGYQPFWLKFHHNDRNGFYPLLFSILIVTLHTVLCFAVINRK